MGKEIKLVATLYTLGQKSPHKLQVNSILLPSHSHSISINLNTSVYRQTLTGVAQEFRSIQFENIVRCSQYVKDKNVQNEPMANVEKEPVTKMLTKCL